MGRRGHWLVDLTGWPAGTRLILRKERPHPGAQLRTTDVDGMRITGFLTNQDAAEGEQRRRVCPVVAQADALEPQQSGDAGPPE